ncbi:hypothetical protein EMPS_03819 [Entomortierella parvispora]|uniref:Uncharacterized protein n=1 Tax=Entomortierella parvispora TaxID=205924 RepID=A0A9P3LV06_9FUNG|nr:hypothetical protein EMPS_03819 [Entomortierella parvispora]
MTILGKVEDSSRAPTAYYPSGPVPVPNRFCCIILSSDDRLRLVGTPPEISAQLRPLINQTWGEGIQKESVYQTNAHEFKLISNPWNTIGPEGEMPQARRLILLILRLMAIHGWNLLKNMDLETRETTLFFESPATLPRPPPGAPLPPDMHQFFAISFDRDDLIRILDAPIMLEPVLHALRKHWPLG